MHITVRPAIAAASSVPKSEMEADTLRVFSLHSCEGRLPLVWIMKVQE